MRMGKLLGDQAPDIGKTVEQARHDDVARQALLRQLAQRRRHGVRIAAAGAAGAPAAAAAYSIRTCQTPSLGETLIA